MIVVYQNRLYMRKCESLNGVFVKHPTHCSVSQLNQTLVSTAALWNFILTGGTITVKQAAQVTVTSGSPVLLTTEWCRLANSFHKTHTRLQHGGHWHLRDASDFTNPPTLSRPQRCLITSMRLNHFVLAGRQRTALVSWIRELETYKTQFH